MLNAAVLHARKQFVTDAYAGAIGMIAPPDAPFRARCSVAIRTVVVDTYDGTAVYGSGGGITGESRAETEYEELLVKARVLGYRENR